MPAIIPLAAAVLPSIIGGIASATGSTSGGPKMSGADAYNASGQTAYNPTASPDESGKFNGYQAATGSGAQIDQSQANQFRNGEQDLAARLTAQANGQGPSLAQDQLKAATSRNLATQLAAAASARGGPASSEQLARLGASTNQDAAAQSAALRGQEMLGAQGQLGSVLSGARSQDLGVAENQAGLNQGMGLANLNAQNNARQYDAGAQQNLAALQEQQDEYQQRIRQQEQDQANQSRGNLENTALGGTIQDNNASAASMRNGIMGGIDAGMGAITKLSDEDAKKDIKDGEPSLHAFLDAIKAHQYEYKNPSQPGADAGTHVGPMAQEVEKGGSVGASMVHETPAGKVVDFGAGLPMIFAAAADLHARTKALEDKVLGKVKKGKA